MPFVADKCDNCNSSCVQSNLFIWWRQCSRHEKQSQYRRGQGERAKASSYPWKAAIDSSKTMIQQLQRERAARLARRTALVITFSLPDVMLASASKQLPSSESIKAHPVLVNDVMMPFFASWDTLRRLMARRVHKGLEKGGDDAHHTRGAQPHQSEYSWLSSRRPA
jgi:hypothetical protein